MPGRLRRPGQRRGARLADRRLPRRGRLEAACSTARSTRREQRTVEAHLEACEPCQSRLDALAGGEGDWPQQLKGPKREPESPGLKRVIGTLKEESGLEAETSSSRPSPTSRDPGPPRSLRRAGRPGKARALPRARGAGQRRDGHRPEGLRPRPAPARGDQGAGAAARDQQPGPAAVRPRGPGRGGDPQRARGRDPRGGRVEGAALPGHGVHPGQSRSSNGSTARRRWT